MLTDCLEQQYLVEQLLKAEVNDEGTNHDCSAGRIWLIVCLAFMLASKASDIVNDEDMSSMLIFEAMAPTSHSKHGRNR